MVRMTESPPVEAFIGDQLALAPATTELAPGERADVSWITDESPDRCREVVIARGMNDSQFAANPLVTLQHAYWCPPVGKSLWRTYARPGASSFDRTARMSKRPSDDPTRSTRT